jgi:hypothetical protein
MVEISKMHESDTIVFYGKEGRKIVSLNTLTGTVTQHTTLDESTKEFWACLQKVMRLNRFLEVTTPLPMLEITGGLGDDHIKLRWPDGTEVELEAEVYKPTLVIRSQGKTAEVKIDKECNLDLAAVLEEYGKPNQST